MTVSKYISAIIVASLGLTATVNSAAAVEATAKSAVNIRSGPGTGFRKVDALYAGEDVQITECNGSWCHIQHPGPDGWVSGRYLVSTERRSTTTSTRSRSGDAAAAAIFGAILGGTLARRSERTLSHGPDTCVTGYVWRDAIPGDHVCVRPNRRSAAAHENSIAGSRVNPGGAYGSNTCRSGYVWREAYVGDVVCVSSTRRSQVRQENRDGPRHRVRS